MVNICTKIIQGVLPRQCLLCMDTGPHFGLCDHCLSHLPWNRYACRGCASPLPAGQQEQLCGQCLRQPPPFHDAHAALLYGHPVDYLIQQIKFHRNLACAHSLGQLLAHSLKQVYADDFPEVIIPVPLHPQRLRQRGFNQAYELARPISRLLDIPIDINSYQRIRATGAQSDLPLPQRHANIRGAFAVRGPIMASHVAIVDDVMTSAQTVSSLAHEICKQGVKRVSVWCCARTVFQK